MSQQNKDLDDLEVEVQQNVTNWQSGDNPLAPLDDELLDSLYAWEDELLKKSEETDLLTKEQTQIDENNAERDARKISTYKDFIKWMLEVEEEVKYEDLQEYENYKEELKDQALKCEDLFNFTDSTFSSLGALNEKYLQVTAKTDSLHNLSEQLMHHQKILKQNKKSINEKLHYFLIFNSTQDGVERCNNKVNSQEFIKLLDTIDNAMEYLSDHMNFKESRVYKMKYESLLTNALNKAYRTVNNVITEATKQILDPETKSTVVPLNSESSMDSSFSLYYGKFQSAATKVKLILSHLENKEEKHEQYKNIIIDCQKTYVSQRLPILSTALSKALSELKEKHKNDHSVLFRSCGLFTMKVCQDETKCYFNFFNKASPELHDYLGALCQHLYDTLRPNLITINHVEVLTELCGILKKEMLNDKILTEENLQKYVEVVKQLFQDVEERLVFRTNIFFQHDLLAYNPSPGDLAYPEKLEQMENVAMELQERTDSRTSSVVSLESQEVANINSNQISTFRSYTGNSPADLHGMWYPTVKRTLVILSRLYFCLDRSTFQGLAQEALIICIKTVDHAANLISNRKSEIDGRLFQIKHLLIIREQIAPFQVDFTVKEMSLDFSKVQKAAMDLLQNRDKLFTFGSNNALLEFLLEGTPRVKEYLIDSRKEIDKQLKFSCETFISFATNLLTGKIQDWTKKAEMVLQAASKNETPIILYHQEFAKPKVLSELISETLRNMKTKIPEIQRSMQLYLANRETEFILFRPIKNNVINAFIQLEQLLISAKYNNEDLILIGCPSPEQINVLICSVSLTGEIVGGN